MRWLLELITWWTGPTLGTRLWTARHGQKVGEDEQGNVFYQTADGKRRWVIYNGEPEASRVSPEWHGWLHQTFAAPPTEVALPSKPWQLPHQPNMTGTALAYHPPGSLFSPAPVARRDYDAWQPE